MIRHGREGADTGCVSKIDDIKTKKTQLTGVVSCRPAKVPDKEAQLAEPDEVADLWQARHCCFVAVAGLRWW